MGFVEWREENKRQYEEYVRKSKMTKCEVCNGDIAKSAKTCPHCGATRINNNQIAQILSVIIVFAAIIGCFYAVKYTWHDDTYGQTANTDVSDNTKATVADNETLIFEDAYIKAYYIKLIEQDAIQGAFYLQLRVENKSTQEITVSLNNASVNGISTTIGSGIPMEIQTGNASKQPFIVFSNNLDINSVADISDIDFSFYLMDKNMHVIEETDIITLSV